MRGVLVSTVLALGFAGAPDAAGAREPRPEVAVELLAEGFNAPVFLVAPNDGSGRRFVGEQAGEVYVITADGQRLEAPFLDLRERMVTLQQGFDERGLLGMAFHPDFARNGLVYVNYSAKLRPGSPFKGQTAYTRRLSELRVSASDSNIADPASERILLEIDWVNRKHNGGGLAFGRDGYLYLGLGDGGGVHGVPDFYIAPPSDSKDPNRHIDVIPEDPFKIPPRFHEYDRYAQDLSLLYGKILRIDVDHGHPGYAIPMTNPFRGSERGREEIYAWGFRNPFRISFDRAGNGDLFVSGVAESFWETIYLVDRPGNYGWAIREGTHCYDRARAFDPPRTCPRHGAMGEPIHDPIIEYANWSVKRNEAKVEAEPMGTATVGGFVYRGAALPELYGKMVFGDFSTVLERPSGQVFVATPPATWGARWPIERLLQVDQRLHTLGEDADGELYLLTTAQGIPVGQTGKVWKLVRADGR
ncbi:MAG TPA: PQQ-dependent sugar dehydrogenase [Geminicoccaceae bacterium]|nr:PQQ-dependent sugar dehydrogenase [Geminicoccaceae bacterium]